MSIETEWTGTTIEKKCNDLALTFKKVTNEDKTRDYEDWQFSRTGSPENDPDSHDSDYCTKIINVISLGHDSEEVYEVLNWLLGEVVNIKKQLGKELSH